MEKHPTFLSTNIRMLRLNKSFSQEELADKLGISRVKLTLIETGKTKNPPIEDLVKFSLFFGISVDTLLKIDLREVSDAQFHELLEGNDAYVTGSQIRILATTVDKDNNENVEYVPIKAKAGYINGFSDPEYIAALPKFSLPHLSDKRKYRMFPITGDSMLPIPDKSLIVAEFVSNWKELANDSFCIVIMKNAGPDFVFKKVENQIETEHKLVLKSLNEQYSPYEVKISEVLELWRFVGFFSDTIPWGNRTMEEIANALQDIRAEMTKFARQNRA
jgi:transcriptional regulator with XRE-family HTH domain